MALSIKLNIPPMFETKHAIAHSSGIRCGELTYVIIVIMHLDCTHYSYQPSGLWNHFFEKFFKMLHQCLPQLLVKPVQLTSQSTFQSMTWAGVCFCIPLHCGCGTSSIPQQLTICSEADEVVRQNQARENTMSWPLLHPSPLQCTSMCGCP